MQAVKGYGVAGCVSCLRGSYIFAGAFACHLLLLCYVVCCIVGIGHLARSFEDRFQSLRPQAAAGAVVAEV